MTGDILKRMCVEEVRIKGKHIEGEVWREGRGGAEGRKRMSRRRYLGEDGLSGMKAGDNKWCQEIFNFQLTTGPSAVLSRISLLRRQLI